MTLTDLLQGATIYLQLARFFLVFVAGMAVTRLVVMPLVTRLLGEGDQKRLYSLTNAVGILGLFISLTVALQAAAFGNLVTVLGTITAALTIAVGFGMREQVGHLVAGMFIQLDNPFLEGDFIKSGDVAGTVQDIRLRETRLTAPTGERVVVPNSTVSNNPIHNYTKGSKTTDTFTMQVPMSKADAAASIFKDIVTSIEGVVEKPEPTVRFDAVEEDNVVLVFIYGVAGASKRPTVRDAVLRRFTDRLDEKDLLPAEDAA